MNIADFDSQFEKDLERVGKARQRVSEARQQRDSALQAGNYQVGALSLAVTTAEMDLSKAHERLGRAVAEWRYTAEQDTHDQPKPEHQAKVNTAPD